MEAEDEIVVSREMLRAIGADTRIAMLKCLRERQKTQSELASEMKLSAPTVLEHIAHLEKAGLVERVHEDVERKWKYYKLTKTGRKLVEGKKMHVVVILALSLIVAISALYSLFVPFAGEELNFPETAAAAAPAPQPEALRVASSPAEDSQYGASEKGQEKAASVPQENIAPENQEIEEALPPTDYSQIRQALTAVLAISVIISALCTWNLAKE